MLTVIVFCIISLGIGVTLYLDRMNKKSEFNENSRVYLTDKSKTA